MAHGIKTGGRHRGTPNKSTVERQLRAAQGLQAARTEGLLPLDIMIARVRNETLPNGRKPTDEQFEAAVAAAPYVHPRLAATTLKATVTPLPAVPYDPDALTPEQREVMRDVLLIGVAKSQTYE